MSFEGSGLITQPDLKIKSNMHGIFLHYPYLRMQKFLGNVYIHTQPWESICIKGD